MLQDWDARVRKRVYQPLVYFGGRRFGWEPEAMAYQALMLSVASGLVFFWLVGWNALHEHGLDTALAVVGLSPLLAPHAFIGKRVLDRPKADWAIEYRVMATILFGGITLFSVFMYAVGVWLPDVSFLICSASFPAALHFAACDRANREEGRAPGAAEGMA